ncbi:MAG: hypothetical protein PHZ25_02460 [Candidatus Pacebacteria bacterium]|nr:hypothetical protein [Candidatus Paceibacterota bacterium]
MIRYLALLSVIITANSTLIANSEPLKNNNNQLEYETAGNLSELISNNPVEIKNSGKIYEEEVFITVTGYSSSPEETDDTPFITASGNHVRPGVVAANWLPLGSKVKIPELFGEQVFVVEDRMNKRFNDRLDIWFSDKESAQDFGMHFTKIIVL